MNDMIVTLSVDDKVERIVVDAAVVADETIDLAAYLSVDLIRLLRRMVAA